MKITDYKFKDKFNIESGYGHVERVQDNGSFVVNFSDEYVIDKPYRLFDRLVFDDPYERFCFFYNYSNYSSIGGYIGHMVFENGKIYGKCFLDLIRDNYNKLKKDFKPIYINNSTYISRIFYQDIIKVGGIVFVKDKNNHIEKVMMLKKEGDNYDFKSSDIEIGLNVKDILSEMELKVVDSYTPLILNSEQINKILENIYSLKDNEITQKIMEIIS